MIHLNALELRLSNERARYAAQPLEIRKVWIAQIEREIAMEKHLLGITESAEEISDEDLLKALAE